MSFLQENRAYNLNNLIILKEYLTSYDLDCSLFYCNYKIRQDSNFPKKYFAEYYHAGLKISHQPLKFHLTLNEISDSCYIILINIQSKYLNEKDNYNILMKKYDNNKIF